MVDSRETRRAFVCGHPIRHSRSPLIHGHWLEQFGIAGRYTAKDVAPENFAGFIEGLRSGEAGFVGGNVTIPHKEAACRLVDTPDELAKELGAVSPVISITSEAIAERMDKHKMAVEDFSLLPDLLSSGEIMPDLRGKTNTRSILWRVGRKIWRAFVAASQNGYLRATSLHEKEEQEARRQLERAGLKWPWD